MVDRWVIGVGLAIALWLSSITHTRVQVWQSDPTLWADAVRVTPTKPRPLVNHANELVKAGRVREALKLYELAKNSATDLRRPDYVRREITVIANENILLALRR